MINIDTVSHKATAKELFLINQQRRYTEIIKTKEDGKKVKERWNNRKQDDKPNHINIIQIIVHTSQFKIKNVM